MDESLVCEVVKEHAASTAVCLSLGTGLSGLHTALSGSLLFSEGPNAIKKTSRPGGKGAYETHPPTPSIAVGDCFSPVSGLSAFIDMDGGAGLLTRLPRSPAPSQVSPVTVSSCRFALPHSGVTAPDFHGIPY